MLKKTILLSVIVATFLTSCNLPIFQSKKDAPVGEYFKPLSEFKAIDYNIVSEDFECEANPECSCPPFAVTLGAYDSEEPLFFQPVVNEKYFSKDYKVVRVEWQVNVNNQLNKGNANGADPNLELTINEDKSYKIRCRIYSADSKHVYFNDVEFNIDASDKTSDLIETQEEQNSLEFNNGNFSSGALVSLSICNIEKALKVSEGSGEGFIAIIYP